MPVHRYGGRIGEVIKKVSGKMNFEAKVTYNGNFANFWETTEDNNSPEFGQETHTNGINANIGLNVDKLLIPSLSIQAGPAKVGLFGTGGVNLTSNIKYDYTKNTPALQFANSTLNLSGVAGLVIGGVAEGNVLGTTYEIGACGGAKIGASTELRTASDNVYLDESIGNPTLFVEVKAQTAGVTRAYMATQSLDWKFNRNDVFTINN